MEEIKIKIKIPISENCNKLDDFGMFAGEDNRKLPWTTDLSKSNKKKILQYLMELNNEVNQFNNKKENKKFHDALCIMIFYYAVNEHPFLRNNEIVNNMKEDDFKQYQKIVEKTIKEQNISSKNNENLDNFVNKSPFKDKKNNTNNESISVIVDEKEE